MDSIKKIRKIFKGRPQQVGDGFVGRSLIPSQFFHDFSPFLLLDHHGPMVVKPSEVPKGVDEHPHRGIETVTIVYEGALQHRDSAGNKGTLYEGDVQWMTAASGIVHEEKHELEFSKKGGILNFIQLWTNLPARYKMTPPRYQELSSTQIPVIHPSEGVSIRLIAGELFNHKGPVQTYHPILLADLILQEQTNFRFDVPEHFNISLYAVTNEVTIQNNSLEYGHIALFEKEGTQIHITTQNTSSRLLLLGGMPIDETIASYGPFVMNSQTEIIQAVKDYQEGKMGHLN